MIERELLERLEPYEFLIQEMSQARIGEMRPMALTDADAVRGFGLVLMELMERSQQQITANENGMG